MAERVVRPDARVPVVYLAGTSYCGSTLLALLADTHPEIASVGETSFNRRVQQRRDTSQLCSCRARVADCRFWTAVFDGVRSDGLDIGPLNWSNDYRYRRLLAHRVAGRAVSTEAGRRLYAAARLWPGLRARLDAIDRVNVAFVRSVLDVSGKRAFFDASKSLLRLYHLMQIDALDVRIVRLVRDVRAFADSARRQGRAIESAVEEWRSYQLAAGNLACAAGASRSMVLRYEDLCGDPVRWMRELQRFAGVAPQDPPDTIAPGDHHVLGNRIRLADSLRIRAKEGWRDSLSPDEQSRILARAGQLNGQLGYAA